MREQVGEKLVCFVLAFPYMAVGQELTDISSQKSTIVVQVLGNIRAEQKLYRSEEFIKIDEECQHCLHFCPSKPPG